MKPNGPDGTHEPPNAFAAGRSPEATEVADMAAYLDGYTPPTGTGLSVGDAVAAVRAAREDRAR
ncbi:hypothetical protein [Allonocardiopsis opalescens]|uniref:Uncharacterized protein n=1 Tax=Allonocardiopsis opalescens TaxID=1144618 RepID=A0A2T0QCV5_9ACTN|nr:hypothetical protein [Allonocardiopsis opalescens]PRY01735.1 hypothetical protein CLV72_101319 [Allonocardiopsis opalescens]